MPSECKDLQLFLEKLGVCNNQANRSKIVRIVEGRKGNKVITKFKVRTCSGLYTLVVPEREKAIKMEKTLLDRTGCHVTKIVSIKKSKKIVH